MIGQKRDHKGNAKRFDREKKDAPKVPIVRNEYTSMFEQFRQELDEHHDRRERIVKASRDITALSKKIIFTLQRVRKIHQHFSDDIERDIKSRLSEISKLLSSIAVEVQGINRYRYSRSMMCIEELIEALTFAHYLRNQNLISYEETAKVVSHLSIYEDKMDVDSTDPANPTPPTTAAPTEQATVHVTENDYLMGIFDLSGEMMRFATTTAALNGKMAGSVTEDGRRRTIVVDMQDLGSLFEMLPQRHDKSYQGKMEVLRQSVLKVEKLGYGLTVRGSERPAGWMPDTSEDRHEADD